MPVEEAFLQACEYECAVELIELHFVNWIMMQEIWDRI